MKMQLSCNPMQPLSKPPGLVRPWGFLPKGEYPLHGGLRWFKNGTLLDCAQRDICKVARCLYGMIFHLLRERRTSFQSLCKWNTSTSARENREKQRRDRPRIGKAFQHFGESVEREVPDSLVQCSHELSRFDFMSADQECFGWACPAHEMLLKYLFQAPKTPKSRHCHNRIWNPTSSPSWRSWVQRCRATMWKCRRRPLDFLLAWQFYDSLMLPFLWLLRLQFANHLISDLSRQGRCWFYTMNMIPGVKRLVKDLWGNYLHCSHCWAGNALLTVSLPTPMLKRNIDAPDMWVRSYQILARNLKYI